MKKIFRNSLIVLLLVGLTAGCQTKVDSKETAIENTQVIISEESNTSDTNSKTSKVQLKESTTKESQTSNEVKETSSKAKETSSEVKQTITEKTTTKDTTKETTKAEPKVEQASSEAKQTSKATTKETTTVVKKSLEEIVNDVLNGKYGNGEERYSRLEAEGYNYDEVQAEINKRYAPAKQQTNNASQSQTQAQQQNNASQSNASQSSTSIVDQMPLNSLYINGYIFPIIAGHTQYVIDTAGHRIVNWYGDTTGPKYVGGSVRYFALHNIPYGQAVYNASQVTLKDYNGNVKTYNLQWVSGVIAGGSPADEYQTAFMYGNGGDQVVIQTCIDAAANYRYWVFG